MTARTARELPDLAATAAAAAAAAAATAAKDKYPEEEEGDLIAERLAALEAAGLPGGSVFRDPEETTRSTSHR